MPNETVVAGTWVLDPANSSVRFRSKTLGGLFTVKGVFGSFSAEGEVAADGTGKGTLTIESASVDSKSAKRDDHLRTADFFAVQEHPTIVFKATEVGAPTGASGTVQVTGELTIRGITRPLSFPAQVTVKSPQEALLEAEVAIAQAEFGITWNQMKMMPAKQHIAVSATFRHKG